jgi:hypothetical protein
MLRQMVGVITTHEAGIGLLAEWAAEHPGIEGGSLGFVDALLGVTGMVSDDRGNGGGDPDGFRGRLGLNARHITLVAVVAGCVQRQSANERVLILALFAADWPYERPKGAGYRGFGGAQTPELLVWLFRVCRADTDCSRVTAQIP